MSRIGVVVIAACSIVSIGAANAADLKMPVKAPLAEPPPALSGYLELYTGGAWNHETETGPSESGNAWVLGGAGRLNYWWSRNGSIQFDAQGDGANYTGGTTGPTRFSAHSQLIGVHGNWRDERSLIGVFGGAGDASPDELAPGAVRHGLIGAEGQLYWNMFTLYGQAGYDTTVGSLSSGPGSLDNIQAWFARATGRAYITPNLRLEGTFLYTNGAHNFSAGVPTVNFQTELWRAKIEHKFEMSPFSIFAAYQGTQTTFQDERVLDHRFLAGLRIYLGDKTLRANDITGATLDIIEPMSLWSPSLN